jgi:hypothetical protein
MRPVHRVQVANSLKQIAKKAILPAIHITRACEVGQEETALNEDTGSNEFSRGGKIN